MIERSSPEQAHAKQRRPAQVEGFLNFKAGKLVGLCSGVGDTGEICKRDLRIAVFRYHLLQISTLKPECRAEAVVPVHHLPEGGLKRVQIERTSQPQSQMHVISGVSPL